MKVLYIDQYFVLPTQAGGTRAYAMAQELIKHGHSVIMLCGVENNATINLPRVVGKKYHRGTIDDIDIIQVPVSYSNNMGLTARANAFIRFAWRSVLVALKEDYDVLFATSTPLTAGIPGIIMKLLGRKKKFIFEVRDLWPDLPKALGMKNPFWIGCMSLLEWLSYHLADGCIGLSPGMCEGIKKRSQRNKQITMVPNGCDLDIFNPSLRGPLELEGVSDEDKIAIFTGAHGIANGLDSILDAAKVIKEIGRNDIKFVFIGSGKVKPHLIERAKEEDLRNCLFYPPMPKMQLARVVASATVGMMVLKNVPAFYYGTSPNKFFDYIASGLPIINNYPGWLEEMIRENRIGEVVEPDNPKAFAETLLRMVDNESILREYSNNARLFAEKEFDREKLGNKFVVFFERIVE